MCVSHRHLDRLVTHRFCYRAKIHTGHHQAARERMPQAVPGKEADASLAKCRVKPVLVAFSDSPCILTKTRPLPTGTREQLLKCRQPDRVQWNVPRVPVLALRYGDQLASEINSAPNQSILFARPHARVQSDLELRHVVRIVGEDHSAQP